MLTVAGLFPAHGASAFAQATAGSVRGTITDQSGAVIPGASISAKNEATGVTSPVYKSTSDGIYFLPNLPQGHYTVSVQGSGFKTAQFTEVDVKLGQDTVIDVSLQPGGAAETVTVTAQNETLIEKDTSQISTNFESRQIAELPSNVAGAGLDTIALLVPGVSMGFGNVNSNGTSLSVNGNRARSNNFSIDGQDNNDNSIGGPSFFVDNADNIAAYQVVTNNFSAEYGRNQGAIINIVTKSGTNQYHGSAFMFYRDSDLTDALDNIEKSQLALSGPPLVLYKVFGGTVGGPIKKDRIFFFGSYQGIRTSQVFNDISGVTENQGLSILPSSFSALSAAFPNNGAIQALVHDGAFALNPPNAGFGPASPIPGTTVPVTIGGQTYLAAQAERSYQSPTATPSVQNEFSTRIDVKISDKDNLYGRYEYQKANVLNALGNGLSGFTGNIPSLTQNASANYARQLSSRSLNELTFNYTRLFVDFGGGCTGNPGCIPAPDQLDQAFSNLTFGGVRGADGVPLASIGPATNLPQGRTVTTFQVRDNYSFTRGAHQFKTGVDVRRVGNNDPFLPNVNGAFAFGTPGQLTANDPQTVAIVQGQEVLKFNETDLFLFFQDDWKIKDNLTLNLGIRYEFEGQPENVLNSISTARESNPATALWKQSLPLSVRTDPKINTPDKNFAPRVGFAYTPHFWKSIFGDDQTVIRGGYSIAYDPAFYNILVNVSTSAPFVFSQTVLNPAPGAAGAVFGVPVGGTGPAVRAEAAAGGFVATNTYNPAFFTQTTVAPGLRDPYAQQWSFGIQRQLSRNHVFEIRYLGTHGVALFQNEILNPDFAQIQNGFTLAGVKYPGFPNLVPAGLHPQVAGVGGCVNDPATTINEATRCNGRINVAGVTESRGNDAQSIYHSLQTRYNGRIGNQLTVGATYTFSKGLDNASEIFAFQEHSISQDPFNITGATRSYSGFDRPHEISFNFIWDLPFYKEQKGVLGHVAGGWQMNGVYVIDSGLRYTPNQIFNSFLPAFGSYDDPLLGDEFEPFRGGNSKALTQVGIYGGDLLLLSELGVINPLTTSQVNHLQRFGVYSLNQAFTTGAVSNVGFNAVNVIVNGPNAGGAGNSLRKLSPQRPAGPSRKSVQFGILQEQPYLRAAESPASA